jgi:predicted ester cyclase
MGANENLAVHTALTEAENRHDLSHHGDYLHGDIELHLVGGEVLVGLDAYVGMVQSLYVALDGFSVVLDDQFATDDRVVCRWRARARHIGEFAGLPATGKQIEFPGMSVWEFDHVKARRGWSLLDVASLMAELQG